MSITMECQRQGSGSSESARGQAAASACHAVDGPGAAAGGPLAVCSDSDTLPGASRSEARHHPRLAIEVSSLTRNSFQVVVLLSRLRSLSLKRYLQDVGCLFGTVVRLGNLRDQNGCQMASQYSLILVLVLSKLEYLELAG